jgi:hypothetical protein
MKRGLAIVAGLLIATSGFAGTHRFAWEVNPLNHLPYLSAGEKIKEFRIYWSEDGIVYGKYGAISLANPDAPPTEGEIEIVEPLRRAWFYMTARNHRGQESDPSNIVYWERTGPKGPVDFKAVPSPKRPGPLLSSPK